MTLFSSCKKAEIRLGQDAVIHLAARLPDGAPFIHVPVHVYDEKGADRLKEILFQKVCLWRDK